MTTAKLVRSIVLALVLVIYAPVGAAPKVGVLMKAKSQFWALAERGARQAGDSLEVELVVRTPQRESDIGAQVQMFAALVEEGCEAIVVAPNSTEALVEPIFAARTRGVVVVVVDTRLAGDVAPVFVGVDQVEAGRTAGHLVAGMVADGDVVCIFRHNLTSGATQQREAGALEALGAAHPGLVVRGDIYASVERGGETLHAAELLEKNPTVKAIIASGTPGTMGLLHVLKERDMAGKVHFVGFGYNLNRTVAAALESGAMDAWIAQLPAEMGSRAIEVAVALLNAEKVDPVVNTRFEVITKENYRDPGNFALMLD